MVSQGAWPKAARSVGNAGVMLVGKSKKHLNMPVTLLGGRFYSGKKKYAYTDFGGGVERKKGETPHQGALREFVEEIFGVDEKQAKAMASQLCAATESCLVGGRPFVHRGNYAMFVVQAEVIVETLQLHGAEDESAVDVLFREARRNSELTSIAMIHVEELLRAAVCGGNAHPLSVRQLDGEDRNSEEIVLRSVLVGEHGSICTVRDALESFVSECDRPADPVLVQTDASISDDKPCVEDTKKHPHRRRWNRAPRDGELLEPMDTNMAQEGPGATAESPAIPLRLPKGWGVHVPAAAAHWGIPAKAAHAKLAAIGAAGGALPAGLGAGMSANIGSSPPRLEAEISEVDGPKANATACSPWKLRQSCHEKGARKLAQYVFDMETGDPDDVLTLLFLASHPDIELCAVTITPGSQDQVALVRWLLQQLGMTHVRMGAQDWPANASKPVHLNTDFYKNFGRSKDGEPKCERAEQVLVECCDASVTLVTGAALHNLGAALKIDGFHLGRWVAQGGFAGEGVVPPEKQMDKFKGKYTCSTWNFGGNIPAAEAALGSQSIDKKICVSKNVCHSVVYDDRLHRTLQEVLTEELTQRPKARRAAAFQIIYGAMDRYLMKKPGGKALHDPLALATAIDESVCELVEVQLFCQKGQWGSKLRPGSNTWISISYDAVKFENALLC